MVDGLSENERNSFNLAVDLYTRLFFDQKELITRIIETAYREGVREGIEYAKQLQSDKGSIQDIKIKTDLGTKNEG